MCVACPLPPPGTFRIPRKSVPPIWRGKGWVSGRKRYHVANDALKARLTVFDDEDSREGNELLRASPSFISFWQEIKAKVTRQRAKKPALDFGNSINKNFWFKKAAFHMRPWAKDVMNRISDCEVFF
jgi:hypothetical protein